MTLAKTPATALSAVTVAASNKQDQATGSDLSQAVDLFVGYTLTFNASATLGARIDVFADPASASAAFSIGTYDNAIDSGDIALSAGHAVSGGFQMQRSAKYIKIRLVNLDTAQSITGASVYIMPQIP